MKRVQILNASYSSYAHLVGQTLSVIPFNGQYMPISEINKRNKILINGNDCIVLKGIIQ
jgi:hypothetical protein